MNLGKYSFKFGLGFLKEVNRRHKSSSNGVTINFGLENIVSNLLNEDVETLFDVLKLANKTESPKATDAELEELIGESEDISALFDELIEAMEESNFTREKTTKVKNTVRTAQEFLAKK